VLSPDERARAARFHFEADRHRAVVTWGLVRTVLGRIVGRAPASLRFERGDQGKPALADGPAFNISDSHDHLLMAIAADGRLGVDVEVRRPVTDLLQLAGGNFSPEETCALQTLPPSERERAFFRIWTCKEAFVKALGGGLYIPLDSFSVAPPAHNGRVELRIDGPERATRWSLYAIGWDPTLEAAVAWDQAEARLVWAVAADE
jgi:4'-phosphopantetheinyl transferase